MLIKIPTQVNSRHSASQYWLLRKLAIDDIKLPDYNRPLKEIKKVESPFKTLSAIYGFAWNVIFNI